MKYYKIIMNNEFIGAINSDNFFKESATKRHLTLSDENLGQFVEYQGLLYRDYWMKPIPDNTRIFEHALITEITEEEYEIFMEAINHHESIIYDDDEPVQPQPSVEDPDEALEYVRYSKLNEMSSACHTAIEAGFDLIIRGETHHFSLTTQDQLNLMNLNLIAQTEDLIPYHADGEECEFYTAAEINEIITTATNFKNYQLAYHNALKTYINALDTIEAIAAIEYGTPIPDEYKSDVLRVLE